MPRFVVLLHETPAGFSRGTHFDLMLERGDVLWTWALDQLPSVNVTTTAERLLDHRPVYLDYEGEVAGQRGQIRRVDAGFYELLVESADSLTLRMDGSQLRGGLVPFL